MSALWHKERGKCERQKTVKYGRKSMLVGGFLLDIKVLLSTYSFKKCANNNEHLLFILLMKYFSMSPVILLMVT